MCLSSTVIELLSFPHLYFSNRWLFGLAAPGPSFASSDYLAYLSRGLRFYDLNVINRSGQRYHPLPLFLYIGSYA